MFFRSCFFRSFRSFVLFVFSFFLMFFKYGFLKIVEVCTLEREMRLNSFTSYSIIDVFFPICFKPFSRFYKVVSFIFDLC